MRLYFRILKVNLINAVQREVAYFGNNWSNVFSTFIFTITQIVLIEFLFNNITAIGPFSKNDMYFLLFVSQISFYIQHFISFEGATALSDDVNSGALDFVFLRPIPQRLHIYTKSISVVMSLFQSTTAMLPIFIIINWSEIKIEPINLMAGIAIFVMGFIIDHTLIYMLALTSFWTGSSQFTLNYFWAERNETKVSFGDLSSWFKFLVFTVVPAFISSALATSVMLGYVPAGLWLLITFVAMIAWLMFGNFMWNRANRQYSSASS